MFKFENLITKEEKTVMYAIVTGTKKDGKTVRNIELIEDGTPKTINNVLHASRDNRQESAKQDFLAREKAKEAARIRKDKEAKAKL